MRLELVGSNSHRLARQLGELPSSVEVVQHGRLPASGVHERMASVDALLFPSLFEEWGYVAVEAMQRGTPVVTLSGLPVFGYVRRADGLSFGGDGRGLLCA